MEPLLPFAIPFGCGGWKRWTAVFRIPFLITVLQLTARELALGYSAIPPPNAWPMGTNDLVLGHKYLANIFGARGQNIGAVQFFTDPGESKGHFYSSKN